MCVCAKRVIRGYLLKFGAGVFMRGGSVECVVVSRGITS